MTVDIRFTDINGQKWAVTSDERQFILNKVVVGKSGKAKGVERYDADSYFMKLEHLADRLTDKIAYQTNATTFAEIKEAIVATKESLRRIFGEAT